MSTVNKKIADKVIAGAYPKDKIIAIIRYENIFNGAEAYKLIFEHQTGLKEDILSGLIFTLRNPTLYWEQPE